MSLTSASPSAINGLLFVATDVSADDDLDFNRWYDREHVEERVRIPGFLSGARYVSRANGRKYLGLYRTESLTAFTTDDYRAAFERQTPWSVANLGRMQDPMRRVCAVHAVTGFGSGSQLVVLPLPATDYAEALIVAARELGLALSDVDGFVQSYLLVPDPVLSTPLPRESTEQRVLAPIFVVEASTEAGAQALRDLAAKTLRVDASEAWMMDLGWKLNAADLR